MQKVGILTLNGNFNYGNRLQNYAVQEVLKSLGVSVETIVNISETIENDKENLSLKSRLIALKKHSLQEISEKIESIIWNRINEKRIVKYTVDRTERFKKFSNEYILETDYSIADNYIPEDLGARYDYFIAGSDQVWNPLYRKGSSIDFLTFAPKHKRIAYAPSFGISTIPEGYVEKYKKWLSEMKCLSVREKAGANIIKQLTGRNATVLVDPTLMLTKEEWLSISRKSTNKPNGNYLLTYFIGSQLKENKKDITEFARKKKLQIVNLADKKDLKTYIADPSEFIDYINSASVFFTDSFHGAVFSILLERPFVVFNRISDIPSMNSRIDTLLDTFKLHSRKCDSIKNRNDIFDVDYAHVPHILESERNKAFEYLKEALNVKDDNRCEN